MITFQLDNFEKHIDTAEKAFEGAGGKYRSSFLLGNCKGSLAYIASIPKAHKGNKTANKCKKISSREKGWGIK